MDMFAHVKQLRIGTDEAIEKSSRLTMVSVDCAVMRLKKGGSEKWLNRSQLVLSGSIQYWYRTQGRVKYGYSE